MQRNSEEQESIQQEEEEEENNFTKRETVVMKQIRKLLNSVEPDWNRIKNDQAVYIGMLIFQNIFQIWLLLLLYFLKIGFDIADYIKFPVDIVLIVVYIYTLVMIQYKEDDWRTPPFNFLLFITHFISRTLLAVYIIFKHYWIHLEMVTVMLTFDLILIFFCFSIERSSKDQCFLVKDYWWRAIILFMLQEIIMNNVYILTTWTEVFSWFFAFFMIPILILWQCQLIRYRPFMSYYFNSFYLGQIYFDSDILFPCSLLKLYNK